GSTDWVGSVGVAATSESARTTDSPGADGVGRRALGPGTTRSGGGENTLHVSLPFRPGGRDVIVSAGAPDALASAFSATGSAVPEFTARPPCLRREDREQRGVRSWRRGFRR